MSSQNQIHLKGAFEHDERDAGGTVKPGHLIKINSDGDVVVHATEGGYADRMVAEIDALQGKTTADSYSSGAKVSINKELPGNEAQMFLKAGENVVIGDELISAGDGTLIKNGSEDSSTTVKQIVAVALEALDLSDSGDVDTLMQVQLR